MEARVWHFTMLYDDANMHSAPTALPHRVTEGKLGSHVHSVHANAKSMQMIRMKRCSFPKIPRSLLASGPSTTMRISGRILTPLCPSATWVMISRRASMPGVVIGRAEI